jgi:DNA (cytosine-5)-methyltransferase 1
VNLFAGLTLDTSQAATRLGVAADVRLAVDLEESATDVHADNFKKADVETASIDDYFNGVLGARLTALEKRTRDHVGELHLLVGGPPCQGHSDLNNHTRRDDPKNALYARMARAAEVLRPQFVLIENVPTVRNDISDVVGTTRSHLEAKKYVVAEETVSLHALGVAQRRKRHIMLASRNPEVDPAAILKGLTDRKPDPKRNLRWAIGDLEKLEETTYATSSPSPATRRRSARDTSIDGCGAATSARPRSSTAATSSGSASRSATRFRPRPAARPSRSGSRSRRRFESTTSRRTWISTLCASPPR